MKARFSILLALCLACTACGIARQNAVSPNDRLAQRTGHGAIVEPPVPQKPKETRPEKIDKPQVSVSDRQETPKSTSMKGRELVTYSKEFLGKPYKYAGNGPGSFDCSGFTSYVFRHFGITLPRSSQDQFSVGRPVGRTNDIQPGDLVFFARNGRIFHVGIAVESRGDHFTFIHASNSGVIVSKSDETYWKPKYYGAKRVLP